MKLFQTQFSKILIVYQGLKSPNLLLYRQKHGFWYRILDCALLYNQRPDFQVYSSVTIENITLKLWQAPVEHHRWPKLVKNRSKMGVFRHFEKNEKC